MTPPEAALESAAKGAPPALRARAAGYVAAAPAGGDAAETLAAAGARALEAALGHGRERAGALDLLSADALVTLALATRAAAAPGRLAEFAATLRRSGAGAP